MLSKTIFINLQDKVEEFTQRHAKSKKGLAIFLTYDFNPDEFLRIFGKVVKRFNTLVLGDERRSPPTTQHTGYFFAPVRMKKGVFHPKGFLLVKNGHALASIGSGNLTKGGFGGNLECVFVEEAKIVDATSLSRDIALFLNAVVAHNSLGIADMARKHIKDMITLFNLRKNEKAKNLIHTLDNVTLLGQMGSGDCIKIISPWHTQSKDILLKIKKSFRKIGQIFSDSSCKEMFKTARIYDVGMINDDDNKMPSTLHAKVYLVEKNTRRKAIFYFGSANCTQPALNATVASRGNVELLYSSVVKLNNAKNWWNETSKFFREIKEEDPLPTKFNCDEAKKGQIIGAFIRPERNYKYMLVLEKLHSATNKNVFIRYGESIKSKGSKHVWHNNKIQIDISETSVDNFLLQEKAGAWIDVPVSVLPPMWTKEPLSFDNPKSLIDFIDDILDRPFPRSRKPPEQPICKKDNDEGDDDQVEDTLTKCDHQGYLDKIAVRAHLLKNRLNGDEISNVIKVVKKYEARLEARDIQRTTMTWLVKNLKKSSNENS